MLWAVGVDSGYGEVVESGGVGLISSGGGDSGSSSAGVGVS